MRRQRFDLFAQRLVTSTSVIKKTDASLGARLGRVKQLIELLPVFRLH
jgi:hypothetical protein